MSQLQKNEDLLIECEKDLKRLIEISQEIQRIEGNRQKLDVYYKEQYIKDYEAHEHSAKHYRILDQDSVWNVLSEQYQEKIKIVKAIVKTI